MKHIIILIFLFLLVACEGRHTRCIKNKPSNSIVVDIRCDKIKTEATNRGKAIGVCRSNNAPIRSEHPDPEACRAIHAEAQKKCDDLPPISERPEDLQQISGSATYRGGKPAMIDGKPVCP